MQIALFYCPGSEVGWYAGHCREAQKFLSYFKDWREHHIFQTVLVKGQVHTDQSQDAASAEQQLVCRGSGAENLGNKCSKLPLTLSVLTRGRDRHLLGQ